MDTLEQEQPAQNDQPVPKKTYVKPEIAYDAPLEATASVCSDPPGKRVPGLLGCAIGFS